MELYYSIFNTINIGLIILEVQNNRKEFLIRDANKSALKNLRLTEEGIINRNIVDIFPGAFKSDLIKVYRRVWETGNTECLFICLSKDKDNQIKKLEINVYKLSNKNLLFACFDTTEMVNKNTREVPYPIYKNLARFGFDDMIFKSNKMRKVIDKAKSFSKTKRPILIQGENATGKEVLAQAIHNNSLLARGPYITIDCTALSQGLIENELFGSIRLQTNNFKKGKLELAANGTLFLKEVGDLPLSVQAILLNILENKELPGINNQNTKKVNARLICSTEKDLRVLCENKLFLWDLYYLLCGLALDIPALNERKEDIEYLVKHFVEEFNKQEGCNKFFSKEAINLLKQYNWPGNIRELIDVVECACILAVTDEVNELILVDILGIQVFVQDHLESKDQKDKLKNILESVDGNVSEAARILNVSRTTIYRWLKKTKEG